ncbi:hypothetical protein L9F63_016966 [Diploptera punctata]|uniref:Uncharacterized protein n=1 Tax=Diploptera punctata TaxID=6984 RepID=A0AAD8A0K2_DIPPU|nr:hypothetical protein L9F63_016966 [Diploptera punctata]
MEEIDLLFCEVHTVRKELEKNGVYAVDSNEIFEMLELYFSRSDRVQYVVSNLLLTYGPTADVSGSEISVSDDSCDIVDFYRNSPEYDIKSPEDSKALDLSVTGSHFAINLCKVPENCQKGLDISDSSGLSPSTSNILVKTEVDNSDAETNSMNTDAVTEEMPIKEENNVESSTVAVKTESEDISSNPSHQNDDFLYDVNNNDPNNNTEYEVPLEDAVKTKNKVPEVDDDVDVEFEDQYDIRCKLLEEARLIHQVVPRQSLEQIYSYLEANLDRKNRLQIVMQEF